MNKEDIIYVCYVQNYLGILDGEDVVSSMILTKKQEIIDKWFLEQIKEADEIGFKPDEDVESFIGMNDYVLTVSKGNEKEGFESYGFVCKPLILEEDYNNGSKR